MRKLFLGFITASILFACNPKKPIIKPDPHLELGQLASFLGCDPSRSYIIIGYRDQLESLTEKEYRGQDYIVFLYINDQHDIKEAIIHKNSVIKR